MFDFIRMFAVNSNLQWNRVVQMAWMFQAVLPLIEYVSIQNLSNNILFITQFMFHFIRMVDLLN